MAAKKHSKAAAPSTISASKLLEKEDATTTEFILEKGTERPYVKSTLSDEVSASRKVNSIQEKLLLGLLAIGAIVTRFLNLKEPNSVVFDEVHFGGFARKYILGRFFMDVHPPLAKLLFASVGYIGGFKGDFEFAKIGDVFPADVPYVLMRELSALTGLGTVILMYLTLRNTGCKPIVAFVTSSLLIIESANVTLSRYILLDSPLIFFIAATAYSHTKFLIAKPFTFDWYKSLVATGVSLGLALSSKWVGLFTVGYVGISTIIRLWFILGDLSVSSKSVFKHIFFRGTFLLGIPLIIYLLFFYVHLAVLTHEGDGGAFLSSAFRASFDDSTVPKSVYADVGVSSVVTLKHVNTHGGYLHSHDHLYEGGSGQQQITLYPHLDDNNKWSIELYNVTEEPLEFVPITHGTKIRLKHLLTSRRLHSHDLRPAITEIEWQNEASCYGYEGFEGDPNDDFIVEIQKDLSVPGESQERVRAIQTIFRLRHAMTGCYLFSHDTKLPKWGFEQQEVTCATQGIKSLSLWYIEENQNLYLDHKTAEKISYPKLTFLQKFRELHTRMWEINNGLTQPHVYESRPESWPFLQRGISYWRTEDRQIYLLGNPVVWWIASFIFLPFGIYVAAQILFWQYGTPLNLDAEIFNYDLTGFEYILGWFLHYYPSFLMARQLFLHHYIPALYFAILALGQSLEFVYSKILKGKKYVSYALFVLLLSTAIHAFLQRAPIIYGSQWTKQQCESSQLLSRWDYDCNLYPDASATTAVDAFSPQVTQQPEQAINFDAAVKLDDFQIQQEEQKPLVVDENVVEEDKNQQPEKVEETIHQEDQVQNVVNETPVEQKQAVHDIEEEDSGETVATYEHKPGATEELDPVEEPETVNKQEASVDEPVTPDNQEEGKATEVEVEAEAEVEPIETSSESAEAPAEEKKEEQVVRDEL